GPGPSRQRGPSGRRPAQPACSKDITVLHSGAMADASPNRAVMLVLAYLWPLAIIPLLVQKDDPDVQWHAKHGLVLMVAELLALVGFSIAVSILFSLPIWIGFGFSLATVAVSGLLAVLVFFAWLAILALHAVAIIKALAGTRLFVPGLSE